MQDVNLEKYNQTGLRDAYNVLKHLRESKLKRERKGGKHTSGTDEINDNQKTGELTNEN